MFLYNQSLLFYFFFLISYLWKRPVFLEGLVHTHLNTHTYTHILTRSCSHDSEIESFIASDFAFKRVRDMLNKCFQYLLAE